MLFDDLMHDREAEPETTNPPRVLGLAEGLEDVWQEVGTDAAARIANADPHHRVNVFVTQLNAAVLRREVDTIREQIPDDLLKARRIAQDSSCQGINDHLEFDVPLVGQCLHRFDGGLYDRRRIDGSELQPKLARDDAREVEEIVDEL